MWHGDIRLGDTIDIKFCTVNTSGVPTALAGTPAVAAYPDNSLTEITAGITLTVDFDARTGLNNVRVVATGANGYLTATNYSLVITAGTVGGSSVVGYVVGSFSIEKRSAVMPTTGGRTLDVSATGEADANVVTWLATAVAALSTAGAVKADVQRWLDVVVNALIAGRVDANAQVVGDKTGYALTAAEEDAIVNKTWDELTAEARTAGSYGQLFKDNVNATIASRAIPGDAMALTAAAVNTIWDELTSEVRVAGSYGQKLKDWVLTVDGRVDVGLWLGVAMNALIAGRVDANAQVVGDKTGYSIGTGGIAAAAFAAGAVDSAALAASAGQEIADEMLNRDVAGGTSGGTRNVRSALRAIRNRQAISGGTLTVYQEDDLTTAWTAAVTTAAGNPISEIDPA